MFAAQFNWMCIHVVKKMCEDADRSTRNSSIKNNLTRFAKNLIFGGLRWFLLALCVHGLFCRLIHCHSQIKMTLMADSVRKWSWEDAGVTRVANRTQVQLGEDAVYWARQPLTLASRVDEEWVFIVGRGMWNLDCETVCVSLGHLLC